MKSSDFTTWFEDLEKRFAKLHRTQGDHKDVEWFNRIEAEAWTAESASAVASVFPAYHPIRQSWDRLTPDMIPGKNHGGSLEQMFGVFQAAARLLRDNRISGLIDAIRVETEDQLLDQAMSLLGSHYIAAAAVVAGGALETHLRHLVTKNSLTFSGNGSIATYDGVIAAARNLGTVVVYASIDTANVLLWGKIRNEAAHSPGAFSRPPDEVSRMIDGIREFIARTS